MKIETVNITPAMAVQFLLANTRNRNLNYARVIQMSDMIVRGEWQFNGSPIVFDNNGVLVDGQHRLAAIHRASIACESVIICGVDESTQLTIDTGRPRTFKDQLTLIGCSNTVAVSALLSRIYSWNLSLEAGDKKMKTRANINNRPTHKQLFNLFYEIGQEPLVNAARVSDRLRKHIPIQRTPMAHCHMMFNEISEDDAENFAQLLESGSGLSEGHPIYQLRRKIQTDDLKKHPQRRHQHPYIIKAWNYYREGQEIRMLSFKPGGAKPEAYPIPR